MKALDTHTQDIINSSQAIPSLKIILKELIENSIDANAKVIQVTIKNDTISVQDDGHGIYNDFSIQRNSTSKVQEFEDIEKTEQFGFRGTALHSISVICDVVIKSSTQPPMGTEWKYKNGKMISKVQVAMQKGTIITVSNFFHPLPVRFSDFQKNLKRYQKECIEFLYYYCFLPIRLKIVTDKTVDTDGTLPNAIQKLFGSKQFKEMAEIKTDNMYGYISKPHSSALRKDKKQYLFLNNRPIVLSSLMKKIQAVYKEWTDLFPCLVLFLKLESTLFDRNVTPDKLCVLMQDDEVFMEKIVDDIVQVVEPLRGSMDITLSQTQCCSLSQESSSKKYVQTLIPSVASQTSSQPRVYDTPNRFVDTLWRESKRNEDIDVDTLWRERKRNEDTEKRWMKIIGQDHPHQLKLSLSTIKNYKFTPPKDFNCIQTQLEEPFMLNKDDFKNVRVIGQFNLGFILTRFNDHVFIVDQHASDEKSRPQKLHFTPQQEYKVSVKLPELKEQGFDIRQANGGWYLVGVPSTHGVLLNEQDLLESLETTNGKLCSKLEKLYASKACRSAVMIGDVLSRKQMQNIVLKMGELNQPWNCPHGRPTMRLVCKLLENKTQV